MNILDAPSGLKWLFVDMNSYFASCEQQMKPELRGRPVVVTPVMTDTTCAIAASYEAKAFGIRTGTPIWEAKKKCPDLKIVPARHKLYVELHHKFVDAIETCIPIESTVSIDEVACKLDKVQCNPENAKALAHKIKHAIHVRVGEYLRCSIGIASNQLLAKLASDMQKPDGLTILHPNHMPQAILHLRPKDIGGIGRNMDVRLQRAGIRVRTHWLKPVSDDGSEAGCSQISSSQPVVTSGKATEVFEPAEGSLNNIATFVSNSIKAEGLFAVAPVRDNGFDVFLGENAA